MTVESPHEINATATSVSILEYLVASQGHVRVSEVARELEISKSMAYNHLSTLRSLELVVKRKRKYAPSIRLLTLGEGVREGIDVFEHGRPAVKNLAEATDEVSELFIREEQHGVPVCIEPGSSEWEPHHVVGERIQLHANAPGKAILASLPPNEVAELLETDRLNRETERTDTSVDALEAEISRARDNGVLSCRNEQNSDVVGVAAPIKLPGSRYNASIAIVGPVNRLHGRYLEEDLVGQVVSTASEIEVTLTD